MSSGEVSTEINPAPFIPRAGDIVYWLNLENNRKRYCVVSKTDKNIKGSGYRVWGQWHPYLREARLAESDTTTETWIEHDKCFLYKSSCKGADVLRHVQALILKELGD